MACPPAGIPHGTPGCSGVTPVSSPGFSTAISGVCAMMSPCSPRACRTSMPETTAISVSTLRLEEETDIVAARQRTRQVNTLLGFDHQDQVRIATAVSEIVRNALQYASGGRLEYLFHMHAQPQRLEVRVSDNGGGIAQLDRILDGSYQSPTGMGLGVIG